ncbi:protein kinase [Nocardiopsis sp. MG754419]|uniref:serine/threonine protein kinase n=1 Tax=Nocardiopsis sp. MG754419 TaxID=2259865 RepID=UPI001BA59095|nr:protein kinase [Nocardiopsis sp. MG754419]MBR8741924.1 serine/threonine protein kinase [Nocardiopsis sp. MG754419]
MSPRSPREISVLVPPDLAPLYPDDPSRIGPYLVLGRLGQGSTGTVYAAVDTSSDNTGDRLVAVKGLKAPELDAPGAYAGLDQRLRNMAAADPKRVVVPLAFDTDAEPPWMSMPYLAGERLSHFVTKRGGLGIGKLVALAIGLAEGLSSLHARGVSHGSLRPSEIILESHGPHIMECAIAADSERLRGSGATWMSPERYRGGAPTTSADVFAWAAVVAFAGTGRLPFGPGEPEEIAQRVAAGSFDLDGLTKGLRPVVGRALDPNPERRPSLREVIGAVIAVWQRENGEDDTPPAPGDREEISRILEREWHAVEPPARVPEVIRLEGGGPERRRTRTLLVVGAAVVGAVLIGGGIWGVGRLLGGGADAGPVADDNDATPAEEVGVDEEVEQPPTLVARFDPAEQDEPEPGQDARSWVYTPVTREGEVPRGQGVPDHETWAAEWEEDGDPSEVVVRPDAEVLCAKFCAADDHVFLDEEGRGTWELTGNDFQDYLTWGPVVIVEITFAEDHEGDGPREVVQVTELFAD